MSIKEKIDQTEFVNDISIYEQNNEAKKVNPQLQLLKKLLIGFFGLIIFLIIIIIIVGKPKQSTVAPLETKSIATDVTPVEDTFTKQLKKLQTQIEEADPVKKELPFPVIDLEIQLDD